MSMFRSYRDFERIPKKNDKIEASSYNCDICEEGDWMSETEVEIHRNKVHFQHICNIIKDGKKFACMVCAKEHDNKESLHQHIKTIHLLSSTNAVRIEREIFICEHCCRLFFNKSLLEIHMVRKHPSEVSENWEVECPKCFKTLKKTGIWGHLEFHNISSVSTCPICLEKCANRASLFEHLQKHRRYYYCGVCHFSTKIEENFYEHLKCHRRRRDATDRTTHKYFVPKFKKKPFKCLCIQNVMKGVALLNNIHVCIICRHICVTLLDMRKHLIFDHTTLEEAKKKISMCACGEIFFNNILLKQHVLKGKEGHRVLEDDEVETADTEPEEEPERQMDPEEGSETATEITVEPDDL